MRESACLRSESDSRPEPTEGTGGPSSPLDIFGDTELVGAPDLPAGVLPAVIEDFARDVAERMGVDPGVVAMAGVTVTAAAIDDGFVVRPRLHDTEWIESARLWVAIVDDVGAKKTPLTRAALAPLKAKEAQWYQEYKAELRQYKIDKAAYAKNRSGSPPEVPRGRRCLVDDITIEAMSDILIDNPRGVLCWTDELSGWFASFDAYRPKGAGRDRSLWLELYNGGQKYIDRVGRGRIYVPNWSASLLGGFVSPTHRGTRAPARLPAFSKPRSSSLMRGSASFSSIRSVGP